MTLVELKVFIFCGLFNHNSYYDTITVSFILTKVEAVETCVDTDILPPSLYAFLYI